MWFANPVDIIEKTAIMLTTSLNILESELKYSEYFEILNDY